MASVSGSFAILKGYRMGDPQEAQAFLDSLSTGELKARNRNESKLRYRRKVRNPMAPGVKSNSGRQVYK